MPPVQVAHDLQVPSPTGGKSMRAGAVRIVIWCCVAAALSLPSEGGEPLAARVTPGVGFAPCEVVIRADVEPNDDNELLEFIIDSPSYFRSSTEELDGGDAPRRYEVRFRDVPAGNYAVLVTLTDRAGGIRQVRHSLEVR
jgi:hypothetical protein